MKERSDCLFSTPSCFLKINITPSESCHESYLKSKSAEMDYSGSRTGFESSSDQAFGCKVQLHPKGDILKQALKFP